MIQGFFTSLGLSVTIQAPMFGSGQASYTKVFNDTITAYSHTINAKGGFYSASITTFLSDSEAVDWIENGVGRHVMVYGHDGTVVFEGFVNQINISYGTLSANRGPLFDVANRVSIMYVPIIDDTVDPPINGDRTETTIVEDAASQDKYGIIEKILSAGSLLDDGTTNEAVEIRDLYLSEMKDLYTDETINVSGGNVPSVTIECLGYNEFFKVYAYNDLNPLSVTFSTKLQSVINADPNNVISTQFGEMDDNPLLTTAYEDENRFAESVIQAIVVQGDGANTRWAWGVYEDRKVHYGAIPSSFEYVHSVASNYPSIVKTDGSVVMPWNVRPAKWVYLIDFLTGLRSDVAQRVNPRAMFIESVNFTAPDGLTLSGARVNTVDQRLSQLGVRGM